MGTITQDRIGVINADQANPEVIDAVKQKLIEQDISGVCIEQISENVVEVWYNRHFSYYTVQDGVVTRSNDKPHDNANN